MPHPRIHYYIPILLAAILIAGTFLLLPPAGVSAQCGSQASSCKNCHEVKALDPVNSDGTAWHTQHAQIDACVSCHAGNPQSTDADQSHTGMVAWNSDVKAGCFSCHPDDYMQLAQVYATTLGVSLDEARASPQAPVEPTPVAAGAETTGGGDAGMVVSEPGSIDYVQQYNESVLGQRTINWGDVTVVLLILGILLGGGAFVYWNERRRRCLKGFFTPKVTASPADMAAPVVEGYTPEVTALLPYIASLNPVGLYALRRILENPDQANEMLRALSHLDPDLVRRVQSLDKDARSVLMALAGS